MKKFFNKLWNKIKKILLFNEDDAYEFKPILAEIEDSPISPLGPMMFWTIIIFIVIAGLWMYFGKVDIVITARGTVIPDGEEKIVQSLEKGVIKTINVHEGDHVKKGQLLAIIDPRTLQETVNQSLAAISSAQANLRDMQSNADMDLKTLNRYRNLYKRNFVPKSELDQAESIYLADLAQVNAQRAQISQARANYNTAQNNLNYTKCVI